MNRIKDDNNRAVNIAWKKFEEIHPSEIRPGWLEKCITISGNKDKDNNWIIKITLLPKAKLKSNQYWEWVNDNPRLIEIDEMTGEKFVVICGGPAVAIEVLFSVKINLEDASATVIADTDLTGLKESKYQVNKI